MKIKVGQTWKHKKNGRKWKVELSSKEKIIFREVDRTPVSPKEGMIHVFNGKMWHDFIRVVYQKLD